MKPRWKRLIWIAPLAILGMAAFVAVGGAVVQALWNWLLPSLFGWPRLGFWQALGLLALCRILFGGFGASGAGRSHVQRRVADRFRERMAERMAERWEQMTPEERERFRQGIAGGGGAAPSPDPDTGR
jgi:hypothetical protein